MRDDILEGINSVVEDLDKRMKKYVEAGVSFKRQTTPIHCKIDGYRLVVVIEYDDGVKFKAGGGALNPNIFDIDKLIILYYELGKYYKYVRCRIKVVDMIVSNKDSKIVHISDTLKYALNGRMTYYIGDE